MVGDADFNVVWITGASTGIGRALALRLAKSGSVVFASARGERKLATLANEVKDYPGSIIPLPLDVTDTAGVNKAYKNLVANKGEPDLCVLNAGTYIPIDGSIFSKEVFSKQIDINWMGVIRVLDAVIPSMVDRGSGHIAVVGSVSGYRGLRTASAYGATKAALINMCEALHMELGDYGVKVQVVNPGFIETPLTDKNDFRMPALMPVDKAAEAFYQGLKSGRFEVTFPKRFTWAVKLLRHLPYALYLPLMDRLTKKKS
ncbi:MAG: putative oxidoreductase [Alphaproteobacteria bacterium MarineAlpha11_Bin1]|nr:MAG: putative oxidoreductase [Alphaproteobacteria bacterium MarineAlpha11_Bin1]|tara:strand:- start:21020 stop:21796 length:777 start_codon:yes stop_codon:yes gene_type:complete